MTLERFIYKAEIKIIICTSVIDLDRITTI